MFFLHAVLIYTSKYIYRHYFYFPAQLVDGFVLSDLLDKPWSQVSSLLPPVYAFQFLSHVLDKYE